MSSDHSKRGPNLSAYAPGAANVIGSEEALARAWREILSDTDTRKCVSDLLGVPIDALPARPPHAIMTGEGEFGVVRGALIVMGLFAAAVENEVAEDIMKDELKRFWRDLVNLHLESDQPKGEIKNDPISE